MVTSSEYLPYKHLGVLGRRVEFLNKRIEAMLQKEPGKNVSFDSDERDALVWAIQMVHDWVALPNLDDDVDGEGQFWNDPNF